MRAPGLRSALHPLLALLVLGCGGPDLDGDGHKGDGDCDDQDPAIYVGAPEACNGVDDDCDGFVDEGVSTVAYLDQDGDGAGDPDHVSRVCALPANGATVGGDCDDHDPTILPGAVERCDGVDQDCDGEVDEGAGLTFFTDADGDGHGAGPGVTGGCSPGSGQSTIGDDCDDADPTAFPGNPEICDAVDNDCDGEVDDDADPVRIWRDADGDGYGDPTQPAVGCAGDAGYAPNDLDCDDTDPGRSPDAEDVQGNGDDEDCDGYVDEYGVPTPFATVEDALAAAPDGAVVQLDSGTFLVTVDLTGRDVTFAGEGCDRTTLYADGQGTALTMDRGRVEGLTISAGTGTLDGTARYGGGLWTDGDVTAERICLVGNTVDGSGGGAEVRSGTLVLRDSLVDRNFAVDDGGGVHVAQGATLVAERTRFTANGSSASDGGAIAVSGGALVASNDVFAGNAAWDDGGAILVSVATDTSVVPEQYTSGSGDIDQCTFYGNVLTNGGENGRGQAIFSFGSDLVVTRSGFAGHAGTAEVIEDHPAGENDLGNVVDESWAWSELAFFDNGYLDYDFMYVWDALHEAPDFVLVDPALPPDAWDLRLLPGSRWIDAATGPADPDGSAPDIGAYGGPLAPAGWSDSYTGDGDGDGLLDGWEIHYDADPLTDDSTADADGDGLDAAAEQAFDSDPRLADTDGDGVDDAAEQALGTAPRDPSDHAPFADAGRDRWALVGGAASTDGSPSWDPDLDPLSTSWAITGPVGSAVVAVDDPAAPVATFTPDVVGAYTLVLTVGDGGTTRSDTVIVHAVGDAVVPDDFPTVQEAIDAASDGDTIAIRPGSYPEHLVLGGRDLTLAGLGDRPEDTVLEGSGTGRVIQADAGEVVTLGNLTVHGGAEVNGAGIWTKDGELTLSEVVLDGNHGVTNGGNLFAETSSVVATGVRVTGGSASYGGGMYLLSADATVTDAYFGANAAVIPGSCGGALYIQNDAQGINHFFTFRNVVFQDNTGGIGSAVYQKQTILARIEISQSAFVGQSGAAQTLYLTSATTNLVDDLYYDDADRSSLMGGGALGYWIALGSAYYDTPQLWEPGLATWPADLWNVPPELVAYTDDGVANDIFGLRPTSPLVDAGVALFHDPDGSPADIGPGGGPFADRALVRFPRDDDGDGMSDGWEVLFGLDPTAADANGDPDGDGRSNLQEYADATDPTAP